MLLQELRQEVVEVGVKLLEGRLVALSSGNISARDPQTGLIAVKPSGADYLRLKPQDIVVVDSEGRVVDGKGPASSESRLHLWAYRRRPDVHAAIHTHSPAATAWSVAGKEIPPVIAGQVLTGGAIPIAPYCRPGSDEVGEVAMQVLGSRSAVLLQNHGSFVVAPDLSKALTIAFIVEEAAMVALFALQLGAPLHLLTEQEFAEILQAGSKG